NDRPRGGRCRPIACSRRGPLGAGRAVVTGPRDPGATPSPRTTRIPRIPRHELRPLAIHLAVACGSTAAVCGLAILVGFRLNVAFFLLLAAVVAVGTWLVRYVIQPAREVADQAPILDVLHLQSRNADPRVRKLEEFLYGSQPRFDLA